MLTPGNLKQPDEEQRSQGQIQERGCETQIKRERRKGQKADDAYYAIVRDLNVQEHP